MSDTCRPQRIEELVSRVRETKAELFHPRAQIEQMMGMMQQLLQAKSADGGHQEETPNGSGRVDADEDSGGVGRAPREKRAADTRVGATTETAARGKMSSHSSRASGESRPADDTGRRPEIPAGVGTMINMQRGEAREKILADTAAHDSDDVLSSSSETAPCCPTCLCREERKESLKKSNMVSSSKQTCWTSLVTS